MTLFLFFVDQLLKIKVFSHFRCCCDYLPSPIDRGEVKGVNAKDNDKEEVRKPM